MCCQGIRFRRSWALTYSHPLLRLQGCHLAFVLRPNLVTNYFCWLLFLCVGVVFFALVCVAFVHVSEFFVPTSSHIHPFTVNARVQFPGDVTCSVPSV